MCVCDLLWHHKCTDINQWCAVQVEFHHNEAHAQTVETRPLFPPSLRSENEARVSCAIWQRNILACESSFCVSECPSVSYTCMYLDLAVCGSYLLWLYYINFAYMVLFVHEMYHVYPSSIL